MNVVVDGMVTLQKCDIGPHGVALLRKRLTIVPQRFSSFDNEAPVPLLCYDEDFESIRVPRQFFFDTATVAHEVEWRMSSGSPIQVKSVLKQEGPYAEQETAVSAIKNRFESFDGTMETGGSLGAILQGGTGFGKTSVAIELIARMGITTMIIVHKEFLMTQWVRRIKRFLPGAKVGIVRGKKCELAGKDIVVAMVESLSIDSGDGKRYPSELWTWPGMIIVDECHRVGAKTWASVPSRFNAKYRLGLTATPRRKDGCDDVFWWSLGPIAFKAATETPKGPVRVSRVNVRGPMIMHSHSAAISTIENHLATTAERNDRIVTEIFGALKSPFQRKIMVLSKRIDHLRTIADLLVERCERFGVDAPSIGYYVGDWFDGRISFSLKGRSVLGEDREKAIDAIFNHFKRTKFGSYELKSGESDWYLVKSDDDWRCGLRDEETGRRTIALYKHNYDLRDLEDMPDKALCKMAKDYGIAQAPMMEKRAKQTEADLHEAERARVIMASYQMVSEGVDISAVDTLVLAMPTSDVEQAYGRVRRNCIPIAHGGMISPSECEHLCPWRHEGCKGKASIVVADVVNVAVPMEMKRFRRRAQFYESIGVKMSFVD